MEQHMGKQKSWWPYALGAVLAAAVATALLFGSTGQEPETRTVPPASAPASVPAMSSPSSAPAASTQSTPRTDGSPAAAGSASVSSATSTSSARAEQSRIEQQAVQEAVAGLSAQEREQAEETASAFISDAYARSWKSSRDQWAQQLAASADAAVVEDLNTDQHWESQSWAAFVEAEATTKVRVGSVQVQNVGPRGVEVAVDYTVETDSSDPWVASLPLEQTETVVVDLRRSPAKVVDRFSMVTAGGL